MSRKPDHREQAPGRQAEPPPRPVAVLDLGTTAVRLTIAEIAADGKVRRLEDLQQAVNLGRDVFAEGAISKATIEECVRALRGFRAVLTEYEVSGPNSVRAVATTAVREASNRQAFCDRIYMATGFDLELLENADIARLTYLSMHDDFAGGPAFKDSDLVVAEVSGGNTELLVLRRGAVAFSQSQSLGSYRMREMLELFHTPLGRRRRVMETNIQRTLDQILADVTLKQPRMLVALGGDARLAAGQLAPDWDQSAPAELTLRALRRLTEDVLGLSSEEVVGRFHVSFPDAETLGPALLVYVRMARALGLRKILVSKATTRHGLLLEMAAAGSWTKEFAAQIVQSVLELGRRYRFDAKHARHVERLSKTLFAALQIEHRLAPRYELLLRVAALLHDLGRFISQRSHHKHSHYVIKNSELFGLPPRDALLVALTARYHRRASPKPSHDDYPNLTREERLVVTRLAAILRVAEALDRSHSQRVRDISCELAKDKLVIRIPGVSDLSLEELALSQKGSLFEDVYGMPVVLRRGR